MDPTYNRCAVAEATLTWVDKNTALPDTVEVCPLWRGLLPAPREHHKIAHITRGGAVKMSPTPDFPVMWPMVPINTGCDLNGTFPIYHGHFDGERFYPSSHYDSICDGGLDGFVAVYDEALTVRTHHRAATCEFRDEDYRVGVRAGRQGHGRCRRHGRGGVASGEQEGEHR